MTVSAGSVSADLERTSRRRVVLGAAVVLLLVAVGCAVLFSSLAPRGVSTVVAPSSSPGAVSPASIYVHVLGAVASPGLYELPEGSRAVDAIASAGGFARKADEAAVNLARFVTDGEQIIVPVVGASPAGSSGAGSGSGSGLININSADATALETLPRIGPAMSARIIAWREENGRFASVDDLKKVTGIGDATFAGLKELVTT